MENVAADEGRGGVERVEADGALVGLFLFRFGLGLLWRLGGGARALLGSFRGERVDVGREVGLDVAGVSAFGGLGRELDRGEEPPLPLPPPRELDRDSLPPNPGAAP